MPSNRVSHCTQGSESTEPRLTEFFLKTVGRVAGVKSFSKHSTAMSLMVQTATRESEAYSSFTPRSSL